MNGTSQDRASPDGEPDTDPKELAAALSRWRESLDSVRKSIDGATAAIGLLRSTLKEMEPLRGSLEQLEKALAAIDWNGAPALAAFEAEERPSEPVSASLKAPAAPSEEETTPEPEDRELSPAWRPAGASRDNGHSATRPAILTSHGGSPYSYTVTVEDVGAKVKLVPLHQSLSRMNGVRGLSLRSYTNGVAVVSVDSEAELDASGLEEALSDGMNKVCRVSSGEGPSFIVRMGREAASGRQRRAGAVR